MADSLLGALRDRTGPTRGAVNELGQPIDPDTGQPRIADTWWGGFKEGLGREFNLPGLIEQATIRPTGDRLENLRQLTPYLLPTAMGAGASPDAAAREALDSLRQRLRPDPTHAERLAAGADRYAAAKAAMARRAAAQAAADVADPAAAGPHGVPLNAQVREFNLVNPAQEPGGQLRPAAVSDDAFSLGDFPSGMEDVPRSRALRTKALRQRTGVPTEP